MNIHKDMEELEINNEGSSPQSTLSSTRSSTPTHFPVMSQIIQCDSASSGSTVRSTRSPSVPLAENEVLRSYVSGVMERSMERSRCENQLSEGGNERNGGRVEKDIEELLPPANIPPESSTKRHAGRIPPPRAVKRQRQGGESVAAVDDYPHVNLLPPSIIPAHLKNFVKYEHLDKTKFHNLPHTINR